MELTLNQIEKNNPSLENMRDFIPMVSLYQNFKKNVGTKNIFDIFQDIKTGTYKSDINSIRYALQKGQTSKADKLKNDLPAFTASATFEGSRNKGNISDYSQLVCLDFDHIPKENFSKIIVIIRNEPYTMGSFISPSGEGIKVIVKVNSDARMHPKAYNEVANYYKNYKL